MGKARGRGTADPPPGHGRGRLIEWTALAGPMAAEEKHRRLPVGGGELKPARGGLIGRLHLGDDTGERAVAQPIFGERQNIGVFRRLRIEDLVRPEPHLLQAGRIEIEAGERP